MEPIQKFQEDFEQMILHKEFHQLSAQEINILDAEGLGEEEYNQIRATLISLNDLEEEHDQPNALLKQKLMDVFDQGAQSKGRIIRWPLWTGIGLAVAAMFVMGMFIFNPESNRFDVNKQVAQELKLNVDSPENPAPEFIFTPPQMEVETGVTSDSEVNDVNVSGASEESMSPIEAPKEESTISYAERSAAEDVDIANPVMKAEIRSEVNATLASSSSTVLSSNTSPTSYKWDSAVISETVLKENGKASKRKKEKSKASFSLADFPQSMDKTVTVY